MRRVRQSACAQLGSLSIHAGRQLLNGPCSPLFPYSLAYADCLFSPLFPCSLVYTPTVGLTRSRERVWEKRRVPLPVAFLSLCCLRLHLENNQGPAPPKIFIKECAKCAQSACFRVKFKKTKVRATFPTTHTHSRK